jgi:hypothetical protein
VSDPEKTPVTPQIVGFVSRADAKLRPPRSVSRKITPGRGGAAVHYGGPAQKIRSHADCVARWRAWQAFHMDTHGWVDIAYTGGFCDHGYAFAGRGLGIRTAANGTNTGNESFYAFTWIGGDGETPTVEAHEALAWWVQQARDQQAGTGVQPHRAFKSTTCPGPHLVAAAARLDGKPFSPPAPPTPPPVKEAPSMILVLDTNDHHLYLCDRTGASKVGVPERDALLSKGTPMLGKDTDEAARRDMLVRRGVEL